MAKLIICLVLLVAVAFPMEGVVELTDANFKEQVYGEPKFWLVMFSASWVKLYHYLVWALYSVKT